MLGLSLTSDTVGWVLVEAGDQTDTDGVLLDYDGFAGFDICGDTQVVDAAACGAAEIAAAHGHTVHGVRVTWTEDFASAGSDLLNELAQLGFRNVVAIHPQDAATRANEIESADAGPWSLARGAALVPTTNPVAPRLSRRRKAARFLLCAAAAIIAALCASAGSAATANGDPASEISQAANAADGPAVVANPPTAAVTWVAAVDPVSVVEPVSYSAAAFIAPTAPVQQHLTGVPVPGDFVGPSPDAPQADGLGPDPTTQLLTTIVGALP